MTPVLTLDEASVMNQAHFVVTRLKSRVLGLGDYSEQQVHKLTNLFNEALDSLTPTMDVCVKNMDCYNVKVPQQDR